MMARFFVTAEELSAEQIILTGENAQHAKVLRLKAGEEVLVCDGEGMECLCEVIAMGSGTDAAIEAADVVFMTAKAAAIPEALELAAQTKRIAWQNVAFALGIKLLVMILGIFGYASMWAAVFADSGVAMLCVLYAILPLYSKKYRQIER